MSNPTGTDSWGDRVPLPDANKRSPRVYTNLQNIDLSTVTFANVEATGDPIQIEDINEDELRRIVLVNLARMCVAGEWTGLLEAGGGTDAAVFAPFSPADGATSDEAFIPTAPIASGWGNSMTYGSQYDTPSHYPFYSGSYTEIEEMAVFFTGTTATAGTTGSLAIYTLSTADDTGWEIGRPMTMVTNSEMSYATDTGGRVEITPGSTVTLEEKTWYSIGIVGDQSYVTYPTAYRASSYDLYWGNPNYGGLKAAGETDYTLPSAYTSSDTWTASTLSFHLPKLQWRGTN